jgi:hypothetical protein
MWEINSGLQFPDWMGFRDVGYWGVLIELCLWKRSKRVGYLGRLARVGVAGYRVVLSDCSVAQYRIKCKDSSTLAAGLEYIHAIYKI